jgi:uncharacterized protein
VERKVSRSVSATTRIKREFQVFVKPVGPVCNLDCSYCYYVGRKTLYPGKAQFRMNDDLLEMYIVQHIEAVTDPTIFFSWHGGEPTMAGIDFFRKTVMLQQRHLPPGRTILNGIQTNGTLLDDNWCSFLAENHFMVGISLDGPEELHDLHRKNKTGKGSFREAQRGYELLQNHGIDPEILCVVNSLNVKYPLRVYDYFKNLGASYMTFLPLVKRQPGSPSGVTSDSVPAESFGHFLMVIFDEWINKDIGRVQVQVFEEALRTAFNREHTLCIFKVNCGGVPVVEHNGDFYSCDHFVDKDHFLGNITEKTLEWFLDCPEQKAFGEAKSQTLPQYCKICPVINMCNGECPKNRFIKTPAGEPYLNYLCQGYQLFFTHCQPFVEALKQVAGPGD